MPDEPNPVYNGRTCVYCDPEDTQVKCRQCREGVCRHAKLRHRTWNIAVTPNTGFVGTSYGNGLSFEAVNGCCDRLTAFQCSQPYPSFETCPTRVVRSEIYQWRRYSQTYTNVLKRWRICTDGGLNCVKVGPVDVCTQTIERVKACVLGWVLVTEVTQVRLFITRTGPRYSCSPNRCQFRLALVIDGKIGLSWATQITEGTNATGSAATAFCGESPSCSNGTSGVWPIGSPPTFNAASVPVTLYPWRQILRRSVDTLDFPMVFNPGNSVANVCGPKCAADIGGTYPTIADAPTFTCDGFPALIDCTAGGGGGAGEDVGLEDCPAGTCEQCDTYPFKNDFQKICQTQVTSSDTGVQSTGQTPNTVLPLEWTVNLW